MKRGWSARWPLLCASCAISVILCTWIASVLIFTDSEQENVIDDIGKYDTAGVVAGRRKTGPIERHAGHLNSSVSFQPACRSGFIWNQTESLKHGQEKKNSGSCAPCPPGTFSFPGWLTCRPHITCEDLTSGAVRIVRYLASGAIKHVFLGQYTSYGSIPVAYAICHQHADDFRHHIEVLKDLSPNEKVVQLLGECQGKYVITQYWKLGHAGNLEQLLARRENDRFNHVALRLELAIDFVSSLAVLHRNHYVMCDGNDVTKLLSQFLITDDWHLVVNDLDAAAKLARLADGKMGKIHCGHRQLFPGEMIAPEQLWPFGNEPFEESRMPGYDEKIDIWRIPPVIKALLGTNVNASKNVLEHLKPLFDSCRLQQPDRRPSAAEVVEELQRVREVVSLNYALRDTC